jgi:type I restriction enzyme S subunit
MSESLAESDFREGYKTVKLGPREIKIPGDWRDVPFDEAIELNPRYDKPDSGTFDFLPMDAIDEDKQTIEYWNRREKDDCTTTWFKNGDTVYAKITPCTENGKIALIKGMETELGSGSTEFLVFHPREGVTDERYVYYLSNLPEFRSVTISLMEGSTGRQRVPSDVFSGGIHVPLPPLPEQRRIADVLSTVDEQIQQTDEMIETTKELKRGLIQSLVFYGPDHDDTQPVQLGPAQTEIAASWDVTPLGDVAEKVQYGSSESLSQEGEYPIFRMNNIEGGRMVDSPMKYTDLSPEEAEKYRVEKGDILFNRTNSIELVGKCGIFDLDGEYVFASYLIRVQTTDEMNPYFLNYYLNSHTGQGILKAYATRGASQANINATSLKSVNVPLPPRDVQDRIVDQIQTVEQKIAEEREHKHHLQDLKRGLMQDLLTGRKRVQQTTASNDD